MDSNAAPVLFEDINLGCFVMSRNLRLATTRDPARPPLTTVAVLIAFGHAHDLLAFVAFAGSG